MVRNATIQDADIVFELVKDFATSFMPPFSQMDLLDDTLR